MDFLPPISKYVHVVQELHVFKVEIPSESESDNIFNMSSTFKST